MLPEAIADKLARMDIQFTELESRLGDPEVMADHNAVRDLSIKRAAIEPVVEAYRELVRLRAEAEDLESAVAGDDAELAEMAREELPSLIDRAAELVDRVKSSLVTADDRRVGSVILELRAGTGGDEAGLWCRDLMNMYAKYAAKKGRGAPIEQAHAALHAAATAALPDVATTAPPAEEGAEPSVVAAALDWGPLLDWDAFPLRKFPELVRLAAARLPSLQPTALDDAASVAKPGMEAEAADLEVRKELTRLLGIAAS